MVEVVKREGPADPLDVLAGEAEGLGAEQSDEGAAPGAAPGKAVPLTNAQCLAMALQTIREALCSIAKVKSPRQTLDDETVQVCADAVGPVLDKYGINLAGVAGDYMIEFRAVATVLPIVFAFRSALVDEIRASKAKPVEPEPADLPADGADMGASS